jgi:hypothetical protein
MICCMTVLQGMFNLRDIAALCAPAANKDIAACAINRAYEDYPATLRGTDAFATVALMGCWARWHLRYIRRGRHARRAPSPVLAKHLLVLAIAQHGPLRNSLRTIDSRPPYQFLGQFGPGGLATAHAGLRQAPRSERCYVRQRSAVQKRQAVVYVLLAPSCANDNNASFVARARETLSRVASF